MRFETTCVGSGDGEGIRIMVDASRPICRRTFLRSVDRDDLAQVEVDLGYARSTARNGELTMARDWHVSYHRSRWHGRPCVYFVWSAIEHIFTA